MTIQEEIIVSVANGVLHIKLNRPQQLNALSANLLHQLEAALTEAKEDPAVKAILLSGEGKGFCAGADINHLAQLNATEGIKFAAFGQRVLNLLEGLGKPSLAAIHGFALGGGSELAMAATFRIATDKTVFAQPEIKLGIMPGYGGTQRLSRLVGMGRALDLCLTGRRITAVEALQWGFLTEVVTEETLLVRAETFLHDLTQFSTEALQSILTATYRGFNLPLNEALQLEAAHFGLCCATTNKQEGVSAFLEKRKPFFNGE